MSNNKQSSVDAIIKFMKENQYFIGDDLYGVFEQAKVTHRDEIMDARTNGMWYVKEKYGEVRTNKDYYNQTFQNEK